MKSLYDDFDEFEFDGAAVVSRVLREQARYDERRASRKSSGPRDWEDWDDEDYDDEDWDDYDDYDDNELGSHYGRA